MFIFPGKSTKDCERFSMQETVVTDPLGSVGLCLNVTTEALEKQVKWKLVAINLLSVGVNVKGKKTVIMITLNGRSHLWSRKKRLCNFKQMSARR